MGLLLGFVKNRTIPIILDFCSKLVLTVDFLVDCSLSFYAYSDSFLMYIFCCVLGETHWLLNPWAEPDILLEGYQT